MKSDSRNYTIASLLLLYSFLLLSCNGCSVESTELSNDYVLWGNSKLVASKVTPHYNAIYPVVTDYAFNNEFILIEQHPRKEEVRSSLGESLLRRFENCRLYKKDPNILKDSFYSHLKGLVEKDSALYRNFIYHGATSDESKNREISIHMAEHMVENDPYYKRILGNKVNYWIISHINNSLFVPLTKEEYFFNKQKLGVPADLKLEFEK